MTEPTGQNPNHLAPPQQAELNPYEVLADNFQAEQLVEIKDFIARARPVLTVGDETAMMSSREWSSPEYRYLGSYNSETGVSTVSRSSVKDSSMYETFSFSQDEKSGLFQVRFDDSSTYMEANKPKLLDSEWNISPETLSWDTPDGNKVENDSAHLAGIVNDDSAPTPLRTKAHDLGAEFAKQRLSEVLPDAQKSCKRNARVVSFMKKALRYIPIK